MNILTFKDIRKQLIMVLMLGLGLTVQAQRATIDDVQALGFMPEFDEMGPTGINLVAGVCPDILFR